MPLPSDPHDVDAVLGGIEDIQQNLESSDLTVRLEALNRAWGYGDAGRALLQQALSDRTKAVQQRAHWLLHQPTQTGRSLPPAPQWNLIERLAGDPGYDSQHVSRFANRTVQEGFTPDNAWQNPSQVAYALRSKSTESYNYENDDENDDDDEDDMSTFLDVLSETSGVEHIEALVFGVWDGADGLLTSDSSSRKLVEQLVWMRDRLPNLKALFIGDITYDECKISWLEQSDMTPLLQAYPDLELLQVRGGTGLTFVPPEHAVHEHLKALILETGGLSRETVLQLYQWDLPALEHLELWFGSDTYGGNCWEQDLAPILDELVFPNLAYLGLRNSQFADEMMDRLLRSPLLTSLQVLDLSLGTLSDEGAAKLLECDAIRNLTSLNVSENYLSQAMIDQLRSLNIQVLADNQRLEDEKEDWEEEENEDNRRYCAVSE